MNYYSLRTRTKTGMQQVKFQGVIYIILLEAVQVW